MHLRLQHFSPFIGLLPLIAIIFPVLRANASAPDEHPAIEFHGSPLHPNIQPIVEKELPAFRSAMAKLAARKDLMTMLASAEVKADAVRQLCDLGGFNDANHGLESAYDSVLAAMHNDARAVCNVRRVYVFDAVDAKQRMAAGEKLPYLSYDKATGSGTLSWTLDDARASGDAIDMPIVIVISPEHPSMEAIVKGALASYESALTRFVETNYLGSGFHLIKTLAAQMLQQQLPTETPYWFREGMANSMTIRVLGDLIGTRNAVEAFNLAYPPAQSASSKFTPTQLDGWVPNGAPRAQVIARVRAATLTLVKAQEQGTPKWAKTVLPTLAQQSKLTTADVLQKIKEAGKVDLNEIARLN